MYGRLRERETRVRYISSNGFNQIVFQYTIQTFSFLTRQQVTCTEHFDIIILLSILKGARKYKKSILLVKLRFIKFKRSIHSFFTSDNNNFRSMFKNPWLIFFRRSPAVLLYAYISQYQKQKLISQNIYKYNGTSVTK